MNEARLQELRAEHDNRTDTMDVEYCFHCGQDWPCDTRELIDLALEAERLRAALWRYGQHEEQCRIIECTCGFSALAGTEAKP